MARIKTEDLRLNIIVNGDSARKKLLDQEEAVNKNVETLEKLNAKMEELKRRNLTSSKAAESLTRQIKNETKAFNENKAALESMRRQQSLNSMTLGELRRHATLTRQALAKVAPDDVNNFKRLNAELERTRARMRELDLQSKATDNTICGMAGRWRDYAITIGAGFGVFERLKGLASQATDKFEEQDEAITDVMKTTGLAKEAARELNEELAKIDTRTAQNELLGLARIGGKLGIQGQEDILAFVRATDKINVALGEDLGGDAEGAIRTVGKLVDIFQLKDVYGLEDALIKTGSAINVLGMSSTANEGYIVDLTSRLAGIAPNANISIDRILGLGATLDKYGQQAETSGTAIGQVLMAMYRDTETFARIAKIELGSFADLLNKDVNEAFLRVLEGMNDGGGLSSVVNYMDKMGLNGQRASTILGTLSKNVGELRAQQELAADAFEKGTSLQEEFNTKNTSATAIAEKRKKAIEEEVVTIGEKLVPVTTGAMQITEIGLSLLSNLISVMIRYKAAIIAVTVAYAAYTAAKKADMAIDYIKHLNQNRIALAREALNLQTATRSTMALTAAKNLLALNFKAAGVAAKTFFSTLKVGLGPAGWFVLAIEGLIALLSPLIGIWNRSAKVNKQLKQTNEDLANSYSSVSLEIEKERSRLEQLQNAALKAKTGSTDRAAAIKKINDQYKDYLPALLTEKSSNDEITRALAGVNTQLERKIKLQAKEKGLAQVYENIDKQSLDTINAFNNYLEKSLGGNITAAIKERMTQAVLEYKKAMSKENVTWEDQGDAWRNLMNTYRQLGGTTPLLRTNKLWGYAEDLKKVIVSGNDAIKVLDQYYGKAEELSFTGGFNVNPSDKPANGEPFTSSGNDNKDKGKIRELESLIEESKKVIAAGNKDAKDAEEKRYSEEVKRFYNHKQDLEKAGVDFNALMVSLEEKHWTNLSKIDFQGFENARKLQQQQYELERAQTEIRHNQELAEEIKRGGDTKALKKKHTEELAEIDKKYATDLQELLNKFYSLDGTINLDITGLTPEEINNLKLQFEQLRLAIQQLDGTTNEPESSEGEGRKFGNGTLLGLSADEWDMFFDKNIDGWDKMALAVRAFQNVADQAFSLVSKHLQRQTKLEQKQLRDFEKSNNKKKQRLEDRLNAGLISETQYNTAITALDAEYDAKQEEFALKQAKREKQYSLIQAIVNTALGVTQALASMPAPYSYVLAGITAAMGAAEIALISSTPITAGAEEGGEIFTKRKQDGKGFNARLSPNKRGLVSSPTILVGENGPEYVIPADGVENPSLAPFLGTLEQARRAGTLKSLDFGAVYSPAVVSTGFASGGSTSSGVTTPAGDAGSEFPVTPSLSEIVKLLQEISEQLKVPIPAVITMLGRNGLVEKWKEYQRMVKNGEI